MKLRAPDATATVDCRRSEARSVVVTIAGIELAMTPHEAFTLADRLVDTAERASLVIG